MEKQGKQESAYSETDYRNVLQAVLLHDEHEGESQKQAKIAKPSELCKKRQFSLWYMKFPFDK